MRTPLKLLGTALAAVALIGVGFAIGRSAAPSPDEPAATDRAAAKTSTPAPTPGRAKAKEPKYELDCDYSRDPARFTGHGTVRNIDDTGITVRALFLWFQRQQTPVREVSEIQLQPGQRRRVRVSVPATDDQIEAHQALNGRCQTRLVVTGTFDGR